MSVPSLQKFETAREFPKQADVVVIGGGIAGITAALYLAEAGVSVAVIEKGQVAAEQSCRNWGWTRQMGRDPVELPLTIESLNLWRDMDRRFDIDTGFRETGITYLCRTKREIAEFTAWAEYARDAKMPSRVYRGKELQEMIPGLSTEFKMALHTANDGRAEPGQAVPEMARAADRLGATIIQNCAVRGVETSAGNVSAVVTEKGTIKTSNVVVAGGAWSRLFLGNLGINLPQLKILGTASRVEGVPDVSEMPVGGGDFAFRKRLDGGYTVAERSANVAPITPDSFRLFWDYLPNLKTSWHELKLRIGKSFIEEWQVPRSWKLDEVTPFEKVRTLDPVPYEPFVRNALRNLTRAHPEFASAKLTHTWAGMMDVTPDAIPVISSIDRIPGLFVSTGFSGHGFGSGPGGGRLMSELVRGVKTCVDPAPFRITRFRNTKAA
ncbi:FAD-binding oxidoreductase [Thalassospira sp. MA62]|nr:FAD-binding oxidoreductase [Thalassospira sp. MA62]